MLNFDALVNNLCQEEGYKDLLYDDKTGKAITSGSTIIGNPTVGFGWNPSGKPISKERAKIITSWFAQDAMEDLDQKLPWWKTLSDNSQLALADMSFNLGIDVLLKFTTFLAMLKAGNLKGAADDLTTTKWAKQVGSRAIFLESLIRNS